MVSRSHLNLTRLLTWQLKGKSRNEVVYLVKNLETPWLWRSAWLALDPVAKVGAVSEIAEGIKGRFPKLFSGLGCIWSANMTLKWSPLANRLINPHQDVLLYRFCRKSRENWTGWSGSDGANWKSGYADGLLLPYRRSTETERKGPHLWRFHSAQQSHPQRKSTRANDRADLWKTNRCKSHQNLTQTVVFGNENICLVARSQSSNRT